MKLSQNEKSLLFSSTEIPDMFFTEYLPDMIIKRKEGEYHSSNYNKT